MNIGHIYVSGLLVESYAIVVGVEEDSEISRLVLKLHVLSVIPGLSGDRSPGLPALKVFNGTRRRSLYSFFRVEKLFDVQETSCAPHEATGSFFISRTGLGDALVNTHDHCVFRHRFDPD